MTQFHTARRPVVEAVFEPGQTSRYTVGRHMQYMYRVVGDAARQIGISKRCCAVPIARHAARRSPSQCRPERLLDVLGKCIDHGTFIITLVGPEEPAVDECVDLAAVKFDHKTAKASAMARPTASHSPCCA